MTLSSRSVLPAAWLLLAAGCLDNAGIDPPRGRFAFPIAVALSPAAEGEPPARLYVVSSNFDLHYNAGALHALDLNALAACEPGCLHREGCLLVPEGSEPIATRRGFEARACPDLLASEVLLDSFASDVALAPDGSRIYVAVRSRANLTFVDVDEAGRLSCGGAGEPHRCSDAYRVDGPVASQEGPLFPADPVALRAAAPGTIDPACDGARVLLWSVHRGGQIALFFDEGGAEPPRLLSVLDGLGVGLSDAALRPGGVLWATSRSLGTVERAETTLSCGRPERSGLRALSSLRAAGLDAGGAGAAELRAVSISEGEPPLAFVLSRSPRVLMAIDVAASEAAGRLVPRWSRSICPGASELRRAVLRDGRGELRSLLLVSCFDVNRLEVFLAEDGRHLVSIREMAGPYDFVLDSSRDRLYVADFAASVLRVFDLTPLADCLAGTVPSEEAACTPRLGWVVGVPNTVRELR